MQRFRTLGLVQTCPTTSLLRASVASAHSTRLSSRYPKASARGRREAGGAPSLDQPSRTRVVGKARHSSVTHCRTAPVIKRLPSSPKLVLPNPDRAPFPAAARSEVLPLPSARPERPITDLLDEFVVEYRKLIPLTNVQARVRVATMECVHQLHIADPLDDGLDEVAMDTLDEVKVDFFNHFGLSLDEIDPKELHEAIYNEEKMNALAAKFGLVDESSASIAAEALSQPLTHPRTLEGTVSSVPASATPQRRPSQMVQDVALDEIMNVGEPLNKASQKQARNRSKDKKTKKGQKDAAPVKDKIVTEYDLLDDPDFQPAAQQIVESSEEAQRISDALLTSKAPRLFVGFSQRVFSHPSSSVSLNANIGGAGVGKSTPSGRKGSVEHEAEQTDIEGLLQSIPELKDPLGLDAGGTDWSQFYRFKKEVLCDGPRAAKAQIRADTDAATTSPNLEREHWTVVDNMGIPSLNRAKLNQRNDELTSVAKALVEQICHQATPNKSTIRLEPTVTMVAVATALTADLVSSPDAGSDLSSSSSKIVTPETSNPGTSARLQYGTAVIVQGESISRMKRVANDLYPYLLMSALSEGSSLTTPNSSS